MFSRFLSIAALALPLTLAPLAGAFAHDMAKGANGGAVVDAAGHHVEFVPSTSEVTFYLNGEKEEPKDVARAFLKAKGIVR